MAPGIVAPGIVAPGIVTGAAGMAASEAIATEEIETATVVTVANDGAGAMTVATLAARPQVRTKWRLETVFSRTQNKGLIFNAAGESVGGRCVWSGYSPKAADRSWWGIGFR